MEAVEAFLDGEWESLSKLFSCEDSDVVLHCNSSNLFSHPWNLSHGSESDALPFNNLDHTSFHSVSQESSSTEIETTTSSLFASNDQSFPDDLMEEILQLKAQMLCNDEMDHAGDSCKEMQLKSSKKRPRVARQAQASKANAQMKKAKRGNNDEEMKNGGSGVGQSSSSCSSEGDDCNASNGGSTSESKAKPTKTPATDPQSLYARKRRERINERLRILQNLVPNGTKVDISTMLEEAVQYVKFLQLQIKLLSSDDMWMFAPIAYNGMDMGLYQRIAPNL